MLPVSTEYLDAIDAPARRTSGVIELIFRDPGAITATATSQKDALSGPENACKGFLGPSEALYDGSFIQEPIRGWHGEIVANSSGLLPVREDLTIEYEKPIKGPNIWFVGQPGYYPVDYSLHVETTDNPGVLVPITGISGNTLFIRKHSLDTDALIKRVELRVTKISTPNDVVRIIEFGVVHKVVLTDEDWTDYRLLEEVASEGNNPVGSPSANEFTFTLRNEDKLFTPSNTDSPFYGMVNPQTVIRPHFALEVGGVMETLPLGTFYVDDWHAPTSAIEASITGYDRMTKILRQPTPDMIVAMNLTVKEAYEYLFLSAGLSAEEFEIAPSLSRIIPIVYYEGDTLGSCLQVLTQSTLSAVSITRNDKIRVADLLQSGVSKAILKADSQLFDVQPRHSLRNVYPRVEVTSDTPYLEDSRELTRLEDLTIEGNGVQTRNIRFDNAIGYFAVALTSHKDVVITSWENTMKHARITLQNKSNNTLTYDLAILGRPLALAATVVEQEDPTLAELWPDRQLALRTLYLQNDELAEEYARQMLRYAKDPNMHQTANLRGNPALELLDVVTLEADESLGLKENTDVQVIRQSISYSGGLLAEMLLRRILD